MGVRGMGGTRRWGWEQGRSGGEGGRGLSDIFEESAMVTLFLMFEVTGGKGVAERRKFVSGGALGQVNCVEDVMCSKQVQQDGAGGEGAQGWICRDATLLTNCRNKFKNEKV